MQNAIRLINSIYILYIQDIIKWLWNVLFSLLYELTEVLWPGVSRGSCPLPLLPKPTILATLKQRNNIEMTKRVANAYTWDN